MTKWPTKEQVRTALKEMEGLLPSRPLPAAAPPVDRIKHSICELFLIYMHAHQASQRDLAARLGVDKSLVNKIVHYHFDDFTIDRLIKYLAILDPKLIVEVRARVA